MSISSMAAARVQSGLEVWRTKGYRLQTTRVMGEILLVARSARSESISRDRMPNTVSERLYTLKRGDR
jgi:hypothetical protein